MSTITVPAAPVTAADIATSTKADTRTTPLWRTGAKAGVLAAVATTVLAGVALAADVPLEIDGEALPLLAFAQLTLMATAVGVLLAKAVTRWSTRPRRAFVAVTVALTALSVVPDLSVPASTASRAVLIATHLVAAAIVIPALAGRLAERTR